MTLNIKPWELVKGSQFTVGDRNIYNKGVTYHPGERFPKEGNEGMLHALYATNMITESTQPLEGEPVLVKVKKSKRAN